VSYLVLHLILQLPHIWRLRVCCLACSRKPMMYIHSNGRARQPMAAVANSPLASSTNQRVILLAHADGCTSVHCFCKEFLLKPGDYQNPFDSTHTTGIRCAFGNPGWYAGMVYCDGGYFDPIARACSKAKPSPKAPFRRASMASQSISHTSYLRLPMPSVEGGVRPLACPFVQTHTALSKYFHSRHMQVPLQV
jgi:hypothetical protein